MMAPPAQQVPSLPLTWHLTGGPYKRKIIFQVPFHRCYVSGREGKPQIWATKEWLHVRLLDSWLGDGLALGILFACACVPMMLSQ